jgi:hypothetical protein
MYSQVSFIVINKLITINLIFKYVCEQYKYIRTLKS